MRRIANVERMTLNNSAAWEATQGWPTGHVQICFSIPLILYAFICDFGLCVSSFLFVFFFPIYIGDNVRFQCGGEDLGFELGC